MAETKLGNEIAKITGIDREFFRIRLKYTDGFEGEVDLSDVFRSPKGLALEIQKGSLFERCFIEAGALAWPNGFELCPDALRAQSKEIGHRKKTA